MVRAFLEARGWTQTRLADEIGVTRATISNICRGMRPEVGTLVMLRQVRGLGGLQPEHFTNGQGRGGAA